MSKFSVKRPFTIFVAVIMIIILGYISFTNMTTDLLPSFDLPYVIVMTTYPGASPEKIETAVSKPLEQTLATTSNIKEISSISNENSSVVMLQFEDGTNMDSILIEISNKIDMIKGSFTDDSIGSPMVMKLNPNMMPVMVSALNVKDMERGEVTRFFNENILPELEKVEGVASVSTMGLLEETIKVELNQEKIDAINKKVLDNIDTELSKAQTELNNAKAQIVAGKEELSKQSQTQNKKLIEGLSAIKTGREEILKLESGLADKESSLDLLSNSLNSTITRLTSEKQKLIQEIETLKQDQTQENIAKIEQINSAINVLDVGINEANTELAKLDISKKELIKGKEQIKIQKTQLIEQENQLQLAQNTMNLELSKAYSQIQTGEEKLNQGLEEFEKSRETAYKKASLDGIITQSMISNILTAENFSMPAGYIETSDNKFTVKVGEKFGSIEELKNLTIFSYDIEGLNNITLQDLADINFTDNSNEIYAKVNSEDGIMLSIQKQSTASTATVSDKLQKAMEKLEQKYENVEFTNLMDQGIYIDMVVGSVLDNLVYGGLLAIIILFIFLKDIKPTFIIALSIPISLTFAITLMYFTGVTINIISLSGLALGVGMLVDNSIVVIENIYRLRNEGKSKLEAAVQGASSVAGAIFASTLTTICVFLPIVFIEGMTRELFQDMGLTIAYSLIASLIVALTLVPAVASKVFEKTAEKKSKIFDKIIGIYEKILKTCLNHKIITILSAVILLFVSIGLATRMGTEFIPAMEENQISLTVTMPKEASFDDLKQTSNTVIEKLLTIDEIQKIGAMQDSGTNVLSTSSDNSVTMYAILKEDRKSSSSDIEKKITQLTQDLNCEISISTSNMDLSAMGGSGLQVVIKGDDLQKLQEIAKDVSDIMSKVEGFNEIDNGIGDASIEKKVIVNKNIAMEYGLTVAQVYSSVSTELTKEKTATTVTIENKDYPVIVAKSKDKVITEDTLKNISLTATKNGEETNINLQDIATIEEVDSLKSIMRDDGERYITVTGMIDSDHNIGLVSREFESKLNEYENPDGYSIETAGENETINESLVDLGTMILLAVVFIYLIMVAQFQSLKAPFIVMFTIPLAFTGGLLALFITGTNISIIAMLGFLILAGVVVNNGIVLIDYIIQLRQNGTEKQDAILLAGKTRLRPILMTALTTILGLSTMALGIGMGADMIQPLGIVAIGGLIYSTLLTLIVVPCIYDIFFRKK